MSEISETTEIIEDYAVDVEFSQVSGFEILEMLDLRSEIAEREKFLSETERRRLEEADRQFLHHAHEFHANVSKVANLEEERRRNNVPPSHWWWYLEELVRARVA